MRYTRLPREQRSALTARLAAMPDWLSERVRTCAPERLRVRPVAADPTAALVPFSLLEHVWHLADLESEGFGSRIQRLRAATDTRPLLPDFDGAAMAQARNYQSLDVEHGLSAFRAARTANLAVLASLGAPEWAHSGTQEGIGAVTLCDLPLLMAEHDAAHRAELQDADPG